MPQPLPGAFLDADRIVSSLGIVRGQKVADFGCGSGYFSIALARAVGPDGRVISVDVMAEPLESVHARAEGAGLTNITMVRADLEVSGGTKIADASQNLVLLKNILFQSTKQDAIIAEAARVTASGGRVVIIDWKKGSGGFGPPDDLRPGEAALGTFCTAVGLVSDRSLVADAFHFGAIWKKA